MKKVIVISLLMIVNYFFSSAQSNCSTAIHLFGDSLTVPPVGTMAQAGPAYGCLTVLSRPIWGYVAFCAPPDGGFSDINFGDVSNLLGTNDSVGMIVWGPFADSTSICNSLTAGNIVFCNQYTYPFVPPWIGLSSVPSKSFYYFMLTFTNGVPQSKFYSYLDYYYGGAYYDDSCQICHNKLTDLTEDNLCIVTLDTTTLRNKLIWNKTTGNGVASYTLYRESSVMDVYDSIGHVPYSSPSEFIDMVANPVTKSNKYHIAALDSCNEQLIQSAWVDSWSHNVVQTSHITAYPAGNNTANLIWSDYSSNNVAYNTVYIYRGTSIYNMQLIDSVAWGTTAYTDVNVPAGLVSYQVEYRMIGPCYITRMSSAGYSSSFSNLGSVVVIGIEENEDARKVSVYPNPFSDFATVDISKLQPQVLSVKIKSLTGQTVSEMRIDNQSKFTIKKDNLSKGVYVLEIAGDKTIRKKLVVE